MEIRNNSLVINSPEMPSHIGECCGHFSIIKDNKLYCNECGAQLMSVSTEPLAVEIREEGKVCTCNKGWHHGFSGGRATHTSIKRSCFTCNPSGIECPKCGKEMVIEIKTCDENSTLAECDFCHCSMGLPEDYELNAPK